MKLRFIQLCAMTCIMTTTFPTFALSAASSSSDTLPDAPGVALQRPSSDQISILNSRLTELKKAADDDRSQADVTDKDLQSPGDCGLKLTKKQCLEKELSQAQAAAQYVSDEGRSELNLEMNAFQAQLGAADHMRQTADALTQTSEVLEQMLRADDFSYKEQFSVIWKSFLNSWKYMIKAGPLVAIMSGGAGYGAAELSPLDSTSKKFFDQSSNQWPSAALEVGTLCGYGLCLLPIALVGFITKDPQVLKATDALAVGTADTEIIGEALKETIRAPRPDPEPAGSFDPYGTPSLHAAETGMMATVICHYFNKKFCALGILVAAGVGLSRAAGGKHFPSQLFLGYGVGVMAGMAADASVDQVVADEDAKNVSLLRQFLSGDVTTKNGEEIQFGPEMDPDAHHVDAQVTFSWGKKKP